MADAKGDHKLCPPTLWAQRKDKLYITINLEDVKDETVKLDEKSLYFSAKGGAEAKDYEVTLNLFKEIIPDESKQRLTGRVVYFSLQKKADGPYWPKLLTDNKKPHWLKIDFDRWRDEDDSDVDEEKDMEFEKMMSQMGNFNTGGPEEQPESEDSDDEDLPDLE